VNCPCDHLPSPSIPHIPAGGSTIARQIGTFPEFRAVLLHGVAASGALPKWRARDSQDFGVMFLEMWAYILDALAFYDEVIAHECYLRTARRRPSLRMLTGLLGYVPRPAVASTAQLAALGEGRQSVILPASTAFRSGEFNGHPPQVFELDGRATIHPLFNRWALAPSRPDRFTGRPPGAFVLVDPRTVTVKAGNLLVVIQPGGTVARTVRSVSPYLGIDRETYSKLDLDSNLSIADGTAVADVRLLTPTSTAALWRMETGRGDPPPISADSRTLVLDGVYRQIRPGEHVLLSRAEDVRCFVVTQVREVMRQVSAAVTSNLRNAAGLLTGRLTAPAVRTPVTMVTLDASINSAARKPVPAAPDWGPGLAAELTLHHSPIDAGRVTVEARTTLSPTDPLIVVGRIEAPGDVPPASRFLLEGANNDGAAVSGTLQIGAGRLTVDQGVEWDAALATPVTLYGNVLTVSRGESVNGEVLGDGDASIASQAFVLKKKPLTYVPSPTAGNSQGVVGTLRVYVDRVRWDEVPSFFGVAADAQVFVVRQNDEGDSIVTFGDGIRGRRVPSGVGNVVAYYRFGAGAPSPPAASITQLARSVKGLKSVRNPLAAVGGADPEPPRGLRVFAPRSALLLGRAVSMLDLEAAAAGAPGVRAVAAEWRWNDTRQRPVAQIYYIGDAGLANQVTQLLHGLTDPTVPIDVDRAIATPGELSLAVQVDPRHLEEDVVRAVRRALMDPEAGILAPERIGIGRPLYRSELFRTIMAVPGAIAVTGAILDGQPITGFGVSAGAGRYFDFETGPLVINGKAAG
jgi:predicted phage baseplate assembly protein